MKRQALATVSICVLLILSGCIGPLGGGTSNNPTDTPQQATKQLDNTNPPGVQGTDIDRPDKLYEAHGSELENLGSWRETIQTIGDNGYNVTTTTVATEAVRYTKVKGFRIDTEYWVQSNKALSKETEANQDYFAYEYGSESRVQNFTNEPEDTRKRVIDMLLRNRYDTIESSNDTRTLSASGDANSTLTLTTDGFIKQGALWDTGSVRAKYEMGNYTGPVEQPDWLREVSYLETESIENRNSIAIKNTGGDTLSSSSVVSLPVADTTVQARLPSIPVDTTRYLFVVQSGDTYEISSTDNVEEVPESVIPLSSLGDSVYIEDKSDNARYRLEVM